MDNDNFGLMAQEQGWSKELLYQLVENVKDYAIFVSKLDGTIISWNLGAENVFGYTAKEAIGMNCSMLFTEQDRANKEPEKERATARQKGCAEDERWHIKKDNSHFYASGVQTPLYDEAGKHTGYAKIARDLTERVAFQDQLHTVRENNESLRVEVSSRKQSENLCVALIRRIVSAQEDERKRIAREIHDHIGQEVTGLKLALSHIQKKYKEDSELYSDIAKLKATINRIDKEVDFLAWELRPSVLDDLGLAKAIEQYIDDWTKHFSIPAEFQLIGLDGQRLLPETEINLYRITQEALNNIAKYAKATSVSVLLERLDGKLSLIVEDNGIGFDLEKRAKVTETDRGMGLLGMKERAALVGGNIEIESSQGNGTTVYVRVPAQFISE